MDRDYLGDGVYIEHDGYQLCLSTQREGRWERIYLESSVFAALVNYRDGLLAKVAAQRGEGVEL